MFLCLPQLRKHKKPSSVQSEVFNLRVALYCRVSTEEQVKHGVSIDAQLTALRKWANDNAHTIAGEYIDAGVSARKSPSKRPELQRLLNDLAPKEIAIIAFTKLDRWTRNIKGYYQVQEVLEKNHVAWQAIHEDYETVTAAGRFKTNIMLSVAENEADRTSERIKVAKQYKVEQGEYLGGRPLFGYTAEGRRLVPNPETAETARAMFQHYLDSASLYDTARFMREQTGRAWTYAFIKRCLTNPLYIGEYRGANHYCEPIIDEKAFRAVQDLLQKRSVRHNPSSRIFIFSGLLRCSCCDHNMVGFADTVPATVQYYYRCHNANAYHKCPHTRSFKEDTLERWLLDNVSAVLDQYKAEYKITSKKKAPDNSKIQRKIDRLKDLYLNEYISLDEYKKERADLEAQIVKPSPEPSLSNLQAQFSGNFETVYQKLDRKQRQQFWRSVIDRIDMDENNAPHIVFK